MESKKKDDLRILNYLTNQNTFSYKSKKKIKITICIAILILVVIGAFFIEKTIQLWCSNQKKIVVIEPDTKVNKIIYSPSTHNNDIVPENIYKRFFGEKISNDLVVDYTEELSEKIRSKMSNIYATHNTYENKDIVSKSYDNNLLLSQCTCYKINGIQIKIYNLEEAINNINDCIKKYYEIKIGLFADPQKAISAKNDIISKNPIFFSKQTFYIKKTILDNKEVFYYLYLGKYKSYKQANKISTILEKVGHHVFISKSE